jgi:hypothetical protein
MTISRLSEYKKARQDAKLAYEQEMSNRISSYTNMRKEAQLRAESTGIAASTSYFYLFFLF